MKVRLVEGPGSPSEHLAVVHDAGIVIDEKGYCPLDDLRGIGIVEAADHDLTLQEHGFDLPLQH